MDNFNQKNRAILSRFMERMRAISNGPQEQLLYTFFEEEVKRQMENPTHFGPYHERLKDLTIFGKKFINLMIDRNSSKVFGSERLKSIEKELRLGNNVIFFANHQVEPDPQILQILLSDLAGSWVDEMIFVAGDRVTRDPIAIPLSLGCNLLCIHSKKYIDNPKEQKEQKLLHNKKTLKKMEELLSTGGKIIYVAPSGGRDRKNPDGTLYPAPFDPNSIELFYLITSLVKRQTHFYPLALYTYNLLPPPSEIQVELGEERIPQYSPVRIGIGPELTQEILHVDKGLPKEQRRLERCKRIYDAVLKEYISLDLI